MKSTNGIRCRRESSSQILRSGVHAALLAGLLANPAFAARAEWSRGATDLTIESAQRCTLDVMFTPEETINLREWRLIWVAEDGRDGPLRVVTSGGSAKSTEACDVRQDGVSFPVR